MENDEDYDEEPRRFLLGLKFELSRAQEGNGEGQDRTYRGEDGVYVCDEEVSR
jgi:hypothetical protein